MELLYYPGCTLKTSARSQEPLAFALAEALGYTLVEMEEWACCGVVASLTDDDLMRHLAPVRNLIHAQEQGHDRLVTLCDMCYNTLKQTEKRLADNPADLEVLNAFMDEEPDYLNGVQVVHFLEFLRDEVTFKALAKKVNQPLKGLTVMPYYGCMLLRPSEVAIDDPEEPAIMADLMRALGAEVVDSHFKVECCGSYHTIQEKELTSRRAHHIGQHATSRGAQAIVLSCPLCRFNLEVRGGEAEETYDDYFQLPVIYYTQLLALALGLKEADGAFSQNPAQFQDLLQEVVTMFQQPEAVA